MSVNRYRLSNIIRYLKVKTWCGPAAFLSSLLWLESLNLLVGKCLFGGPVNLFFSPKVAREREHRGHKPGVSPVPVLQ